MTALHFLTIQHQLPYCGTVKTFIMSQRNGNHITPHRQPHSTPSPSPPKEKKGGYFQILVIKSIAHGNKTVNEDAETAYNIQIHSKFTQQKVFLLKASPYKLVDTELLK